MSVAGPSATNVPRNRRSMLSRTIFNLRRWSRAVISMSRPGRHKWQPIWARPSHLLIGAAFAIAALAVAMLLLDQMAITHQRQLPRWVIVTFETTGELGRSAWLLVPAAMALLLLAAIASPALGRTAHLVLVAAAVRVGFVFIAVGLPGLIVAVVKRMIGRERPYGMETGGPFNFSPFKWDVDYASLPSGHGTTAFAAAVAFGALYPRWRTPLWSLAVLVAVSRVAVSAHYPSDVLAGAVAGALGAFAVRNWFAALRLGFVVAPDGSVKPLPGPSFRRLKAALARAGSR